MEEIKVIERPGEYEFTGYENLKETLSAYVLQYSNAKFNCDDKESRQNAKSIMADLRSKKNQIEEKRKEIRKRALDPYDTFAKKCKELTGMIDETVSGIDTQLKDWDRRQKAQKAKEIEEKFNEQTTEEFRTIVPFSYILDPKWLNQSTTKTKAEAELMSRIIGCRKDLATINAFSDTEKEYVLPTYKATHDMNAVLAKLNDFRTAIEEDRKHREEAEKAKEAAAKQKSEPEYMEIPDIDISDITSDNEVKKIWFKIEGTSDELEQVRTFLNSLGLPYKEREA